MHVIFQMSFCSDCKSKTKYTMITSTKAKKEYSLNDQDLQPLRVSLITNPHYRRRPPMRLYSLEQVKALSDSKMDSLQTTLEEQKQKSKEHGEAIKRRNLVAIEQRRNDLIDALAVYGLEFEEEHGTCHRFISSNW